MVLEICFEKGIALEIGYSGKVWVRTWRMVISCRDGGIWCWLLEGDERRLGRL